MKTLFAYKNTVSKLKNYGIHNAEQESAWIFQYIFNVKTELIHNDNSKEFSKKQLQKLNEIIQKRAEHYPLQYLIGHTEFYGLQIKVNPDVLIPRPETEILVDTILQKLPKQDNLHCADLGTGSGCIALALAKALPNSSWSLCDISQKALDIAKYNYQKNEITNEFNFYQGDWFSAFPTQQKFDVIVTNPPYVSKDEPISAEISYEPANAVFSDETGYEDFYQIFDELPNFSKEGTIFMAECSIFQAEKLALHIKKIFNLKAEIILDLTQRPRFIFFQILKGN